MKKSDFGIFGYAENYFWVILRICNFRQKNEFSNFQYFFLCWAIFGSYDPYLLLCYESAVVAKVAGIRVRFHIWANLGDFKLRSCIFNWILINSGLKLLLYGTRFRINYCSPGNIGNWSLQHSPESWKYWKSEFFNFLISWKY